ncbi:MAG: hypothetical protein JO306_07345, partial [Gemmatimonadetes bacterium]|nr:hypothetical protein [Gemmatimonadota bacterium]
TGASDCGLAALEMVLRYHGAPCDRPALRRALRGTAGGSSLAAVRDAARMLGLDAEGFEAPAEALDALPAPAILHWRRGHFVVFEGMDGGRARVVDPVRGRLSLPPDEVARLYSGLALVLEPAGAAPAPPEPHRGAMHALLAPWLRARRAAVARLAVVAVAFGATMSAGVGWIGSAAGAAASGRASVGPALGLAAALAILAVALGALAAREERRLAAGLGEYLADRFVAVVAAAPNAYLASRTPRFLENLAGDLDPTVNGRIPSPRAVRWATLASGAVATSLVLDPRAAAAVLAAMAAMTGAAACRARRWSRAAARGRGAVQSAREWGRGVLARPLELRTAGALTAGLERWREMGARGQSAARAPASPPEPAAEWLAAGIALVAVATGVGGIAGRGQAAVVVLGAMALAATHGLLLEFLRLRAWLPALASLADAALEVSPPREPVTVPDGGGAVECRALQSATPGECLAPVTLFVPAGGAVAVLGEAGARRAFAELLVGLTEPSGGSVRIDGADPARLDEARRRDVVAGVLSGAEPVAATVLDNVRLADPACTPAAARDACGRAGLGEWLASLPLGERTPLSPGTLPGPVPRLLCLARLLVRLPRVLVLNGTLDELDTGTATTLAGSLADLPCTVVLCTGRSDFLPAAFRHVELSGPDGG